VELDESALEFLAEKGFSPELGARPLKRAIERYLLAPEIVSRSFPEGEQFLFLTARDNRIEVTFVDPDADEGEPEPTPADVELWLEKLVLDPRGGAEETAFLGKEMTRLSAIVEGDDWLVPDPAQAAFALRLRDMYAAWGRRRGMRVHRLESDSGHLLAVTGIGAYPILANELGLHVFESPHDERSFDRVAALVTVAPRSPAPPDVEPLELARQAVATLNVSASVVRRYRAKPSPLVRDSIRDWRTGRLDRVLAGDFDVMLDE
jgi:C-terminal, D2-small domain, of ClpB protein